jgi:hypothetical protein
MEYFFTFKWKIFPDMIRTARLGKVLEPCFALGRSRKQFGSVKGTQNWNSFQPDSEQESIISSELIERGAISRELDAGKVREPHL